MWIIFALQEIEIVRKVHSAVVKFVNARKIKLHKGHIIIGRLCGTQINNYDRRVIYLTKKLIVATHVCDTHDPNGAIAGVGGESLEKFYETLYSNYAFFPKTRVWHPIRSFPKVSSWSYYSWMAIELLRILFRR